MYIYIFIYIYIYIYIFVKIYKKTKNSSKLFCIAGDFNIDFPGYDANKKNASFFTKICESDTICLVSYVQ